jgi:hypothetical protein
MRSYYSNSMHKQQTSLQYFSHFTITETWTANIAGALLIAPDSSAY